MPRIILTNSTEHLLLKGALFFFFSYDQRNTDANLTLVSPVRLQPVKSTDEASLLNFTDMDFVFLLHFCIRIRSCRFEISLQTWSDAHLTALPQKNKTKQTSITDSAPSGAFAPINSSATIPYPEPPFQV